MAGCLRPIRSATSACESFRLSRMIRSTCPITIRVIRAIRGSLGGRADDEGFFEPLDRPAATEVATPCNIAQISMHFICEHPRILWLYT
jgi:hypothetical protein